MSYLIERPMVAEMHFPEPHQGLNARLRAEHGPVGEEESATVEADRLLWAALGATGLVVGLYRFGRRLLKADPINP